MMALDGITIPDSQLAREARDLVRESAGELLYRHSERVYLWGALIGRRKGLHANAELLYAAALFHDFGLTQGYHESPHRFEIDGANAARDFLRSHGLDERDIQKVWMAIALHTTPEVPEHLDPEIALVQAGAALDLVGRDFDRLAPEERERVVTAFPRGRHFEADILDAFYEGMKSRAQTTFGTFNDDFLARKDPAFKRGDVCAAIVNSPWAREASP